MKSYIQTFDGETFYLTKEEADKVNAILDNPEKYPAKFLNIKGTRLAISAIKEVKAMEYNDVNQSTALRLDTDFEKAALLLEDNRKPYEPSAREKIRQEIKDRFKKLGGTDQKKQEYLAMQDLAKELHGEAVKTWRLSDWDSFIENHPKPLDELEEAIADKLNLEV